MHAPKLVEIGASTSRSRRSSRSKCLAGKGKPARRIYCLDDDELRGVARQLKKEKVKDGSWEISRFKGLGEMSPSSSGRRR
jgi:topoisomerase-4 subunit B